MVRDDSISIDNGQFHAGGPRVGPGRDEEPRLPPRNEVIWGKVY